MSKKVLVTGAAGFVGFHVARALVGRGDFVIGLDNFNDYYDVTLKRDRSALLNAYGVRIVEGDICDDALLAKILEDNEITHIVHLAAQAGVRYSLQNPQAYIRSNVQGFTSILEAVRARPSLRLVYASSSSVYGRNTNVPFAETDRVDLQSSLYGVTKKSNELMAQSYHHLFGLHLTGLRFFTVYGPWGRPDMAYYSFTRDILSGQPIHVFNRGKMSRDFTYIDDIVIGTLAALDRCDGCHVYNLGNHEPVPLMEMIKTIEECLGCEAKKEFCGMQLGDVTQTYADLTLSREELGFNPSTSLKAGFSEFLRWYCDYHEVELPELSGEKAANVVRI